MTSFNSAKDSLLHGSDWPLCTVQCRPGCSMVAVRGLLLYVPFTDSNTKTRMTKSKLTIE